MFLKQRKTMRNKILLILLLGHVFSMAQNYEQRLYPLSEKDKRYYVNIFGDRITDAIYDDDWSSIYEDNDIGWIMVKKNNFYGIIDILGREIIPCIYQDINPLYINDTISKYLICKKNDKYGILDSNNNIVFPFIYEGFSYQVLENNTIMCCKNKKWGSINLYTKKTVIPFEYDEYNDCYEQNLLCVSKGGKSGYITSKGEIVVPLIHSTGWFFKDDGHCVFQNAQTGVWSIYNNKGKAVEIGKYDKVWYSTENMILVKKGGKYGFVNSENGRLIIPCIYDDAYSFNDGVARVYIKEKGAALISKNGHLLTENNKHPVDNFVEKGTIRATNNEGKYGIIDTQGKTVIPFKYDFLFNFNNNGYVKYKEKEKWGILNKQNSAIIPPIYDELYLGDDSELIAVKQNEKWGYVNFHNQVIIPFAFDKVENFKPKKDYTIVYQNGRKGYIDKKGNLIVSFEEQHPDLRIEQILYSKIPSDIDSNIPLSNTINNKTFAIIISNEKYIDEDVPNVSYSINDGKSFREYCTRTLGIPLKNIKLLENATFNQIRSGINSICDKANAFDGEASIIVYYSGHGMPNEKNGNAYLLPSDGSFKDYRTAIGIDDIYKQLGETNAKLTTIFLDACFSGTSREGKNMLPEARGVIVKTKPTQPTGNTIVFSASQGDETSHPYNKKKHGMFTYFVLKKLQETKGHVSLGELGTYVSQQVRQHSIMEVGKSQSPTINVSNKLVNNWKSLILK